MENKSLNAEELEQVTGGNRNETRELGQYLYKKFPECFSGRYKRYRDLQMPERKGSGIQRPQRAGRCTYQYL